MLQVDTTLGTLEASVSQDPQNPGIWVEMKNPNGKSIPLALIECTADEADLPENKPHMITRVWNGGDEYSVRIVHTAALWVMDTAKPYRNGDRPSKFKSDKDLQIRYWIYELEMSRETEAVLMARLAELELTIDEFAEAALIAAIENPDETKKAHEEYPHQDIRVVRYYPVFWGETEAMARKRKLAEEAAEEAAERQKMRGE